MNAQTNTQTHVQLEKGSGENNPQKNASTKALGPAGGKASVVTIPATLPFLDCVAQAWLDRVGLYGDDAGVAGTILVPGRRAARALREAFLRVLDGRAALLPAITAIGDLEDESLFSMALEEALPPAVEPTRRLAILSQLILSAPLFRASADSREGALERVWPLAQALAQLMDEAERAGVDLAEALPQAVTDDYAEHWQKTLIFLEIVTKFWPEWLRDQGLSNPVARQVALLEAQAKAWRAAPPRGAVWAIGFVDGAGGIAPLLGAVAALPEGKVVLQGVDLALPESIWNALPESHPQAMFRDLLDVLLPEFVETSSTPEAAGKEGASERGETKKGEIKSARAALEIWGDSPRAAREGLMRQVMLPESGLQSWERQQPESLLAQAADGLSLLPADDTQQEAQTIALVLRDLAETPGRTGALVTPDLGLARRVSAELLRFGVHADNSAGEPLSGTPPAVFLRLIADAAANDLSPVALLAVLKHPLAALGLTPGKAHASARLLERTLLRGPAPAPGIAGLRAALRDAMENQKDDPRADNGNSADAPETPETLSVFLDRIENAFAPLLALKGDKGAALPDLLEALIRTGEFLATTQDERGPSASASAARGVEAYGETHDEGLDELLDETADARAPGERLWIGEDGALLARHLTELMVHGAGLPGQRLGGLEAFLTVSMAGKSLTGLRGHLGGVELAHPRISILGVLEARLMAFDTVILGALNETSWPPATDPGPWLSRPMRRRAGLPSPERRLGASAHDFLSAVLASPRVVLSAPARREGSPAVKARWLVRLDAYLNGQKNAPALPRPPALSWQARLDLPAGPPQPALPPRPQPPVKFRPRRLSVTEIDTLKCDPYAVYAKHVLRLRALPPLEEGVEHADYGLVVHDALERMFKDYPEAWPTNALEKLLAHCEEALKTTSLRPALSAWWRPRLARIAAWVVARELPERDLSSPEYSQEFSQKISGSPGESVWRSVTEVTARYVLEDLPGGAFALTGRADRIDLRRQEAEAGDRFVARVFDYKTGAPPSGRDVADGWASQLVLEAAMLARGAFTGLADQDQSLLQAHTESLIYWYLTGGAEAGKEISLPGARKSFDLEEVTGSALEHLRALIAEYDDPKRAYLSQPWADRAPRYTDCAQLARVAEWRSGGET